MRTFANLAEAVAFITECLNVGDFETIARECEAKPPKDWELERLQEINRRVPLPELYADREFPTDSQTFKLGGHASELGHIHIDFVKSETAWHIHKIFMCR